MNSSQIRTTDESFVIAATDILQCLACLNYLIGIDAGDSGKVQQYARMADERVQAMRALLRPMLWTPVAQESIA